MADDTETRSRSVPKYSGRWWKTELESVEKVLDERFYEQGDRVLARFMDDRTNDPAGSVTGSNADAENRYNMFWANTQILMSALYAVPPKPSVTRENADSKDDVARVAALILERCLQNGMTKNNSDTHENIKAAVFDRLLPGLGQVWHRYECDTEPLIIQEERDEFGTVIVEGFKGRKITKERVCTDYVNWRDFLWSSARRWNDVGWVARRVYMKQKTFKKRWPDKMDLWKDIREQASSQAVSAKRDQVLPKGFKKGKAEIFEVWCEDTGKVYFVSKLLDDVIERLDDPLGLENFFPCPPPLLASHTNESLVPKADFCMVQDQYYELDILNNRIAMLTKAVRVVGAYDKNNPELAKMMTGPELDMVPVEDMMGLLEKGGMSKAVDWFPVEMIANVLDKLIQQRALVVSQIYELTSISDIMRGASNPRETAKAQQLKAQYSSVRLQMTQEAVADFVQHSLRIKSEIICKQMTPEGIAKLSQIEHTESAPYAEQAIELLKDFDSAEYRIDISEESLSMSDYNAEREMRIELITAVGQFLSQAGQMVQTTPGALPYMLRIVQWVVASFRGSKDIETVIDQAIEQVGKGGGQPQGEPPKPDHAVEVAQINSATKLKTNEADNKTKLEVKSMELAADHQQAAIAASTEEVPEDNGEETMAAIVDEVERQLKPFQDMMAKNMGATQKMAQGFDALAKLITRTKEA